MKQVFILVLMLLVVATATESYAQAPQSFKYQSIARDGADLLLANASIKVRISIHDGTPDITSLIYEETHSVTTNALGLFTISVGEGTVEAGTFNNIAWGSGEKFMHIAADLAGGNNFVAMGITQLLSVPYALWANGANPVGTVDESPFLIKVNNEKAGQIEKEGEVFYGYQAGKNNVMTNNLGIGHKALYSNSNNGEANTAIGNYALYNNTNSGNTAVGSYSLFANSTGVNNTAVGSQALVTNTTGIENTSVGFNALRSNNEGAYNTAIGSSALSNSTGNGGLNTALGYRALEKNESGGQNTAVGSLALLNNETGSLNTAIGYEANVHSGSLSNATAIGSFATVQLSNCMVFGSGSVTKWGFGVADINSNNALQVGHNSTNGNGAYLTIGGVWTNASDRNKKENFSTIDGQELLFKIKQLPISQWNYIGEEKSITHIGPMAQDFHKLFGVGNDDKSISTIDPAGVSLAAIQELIKQLDELKVMIQLQQESIVSLTAENSKLKSSMEARIEKLEAMLGMNAKK